MGILSSVVLCQAVHMSGLIRRVPGWCRMRAIESGECVIGMTSQKGKSSSKCDENWVTTLEENKKSDDVVEQVAAGTGMVG